MTLLALLYVFAFCRYSHEDCHSAVILECIWYSRAKCSSAIWSVWNPRSDKSFSICNTTNGSVACAMDAPNKSISPRQFEITCLAFDVRCAWECQVDPNCMEFNIRLNNQTCDLYYNQPRNYSSLNGCAHFQVICKSLDRGIFYPRNISASVPLSLIA